MAEFGEAIFTERRHHFTAHRGTHLQHHAQLFAEQRLKCQFLPAGTDLPRPILAVAHIHAAVRNAITFRHQHVHVQRHTHAASKSHFGDSRQQAAVTTVMVSQHFALGAQGVHSVDQVDQVFGIVQIGHGVAGLVQGLRQDAHAHAVLAFAQVDQDQGGVFSSVELRR